ncbi:hypothetical protein JCM30471_19670 [Desulfuromonas carbonis]|uniref:L,D-transpeptidase family protein n=1 Tax=Desulfuromonas sp. DDH964 TaxID=1823759 RepID=UPI00078C4E1D|nr:L,D-transpeptidase family protein [Desulfuromonas sp. DDH964]AMV73550.1 peptidoglycan L,D-transpeptidase lipoprotein, YkuD family, SPOR domain-containing [Desulfuromonas sp. DDH964]
MFRSICPLLCFAFLVCAAQPAAAWYPRLAAEGTVAELRPGVKIGHDRPYVIGPGETLMEIGLRARLGFQALVAANPGIRDPWLPGVGREIILPYAALLPAGIAPGITINLAEFRLYLAEASGDNWRVRIYPIGLGRPDWETPEGEYTIVNKVLDPIWTPPDSLREEKPELAKRVPPGPDNPLGRFWLGLSAPRVGLHGTNRPYGVGRRVSHGCIRLYADDIAHLAARVAIGTPVRILYQPYKVGVTEQGLLLEIHDDYLKRFSEPGGADQRAWPAALPDPTPAQREVLKAATGVVTLVPAVTEQDAGR